MKSMRELLDIAQKPLTEGRLGFKGADALGSENASKIDNMLRHKLHQQGADIRDVESGTLDQMRYDVAKELGLVEAEADAIVDNEISILEDSTDADKHDALNNIHMSLGALKAELVELVNLDNDQNSDGAGDLHDQITTMYDLCEKFSDVLERSSNIVPQGLEQGKY